MLNMSLEAVNISLKNQVLLHFCQFWMVQMGLGLFLAVHAAENVCSQMYYRASKN
jgi:hypothetical protein